MRPKVRSTLSGVAFKDVRWLQLFIQTFFLYLFFFALKIYNKTFNTKIFSRYRLLNGPPI